MAGFVVSNPDARGIDATRLMGHQHSGHHHQHAHGHGSVSVSRTVMGAAVAATLTFVIVEAFAGWLGHSLALLSDAGHNLADAAALGLSWYALRIARRPSHHGMTFGYHRVGVFAALINALSLVGIAVWIGWEAIVRLRHPELASGGLMIGVAAVGIVVNTAIGLGLHRASKQDMNVRSAYLHMMGDALSALGVVIAGVLVATTRTSLADPTVSLLIAALILYSSYGVLRESAAVLLEGTPAGLDMPALVATIRRVSGVIDVHDLHVWMVGPGVIACSCHIVVAEQSVREGQQVLRTVVHEVEHRFHITHTTVQIEVEGCEADDMYCWENVRELARRQLTVDGAETLFRPTRQGPPLSEVLLQSRPRSDYGVRLTTTHPASRRTQWPGLRPGEDPWIDRPVGRRNSTWCSSWRWRWGSR
jgi:cobalt-zinc-cadmium efflux system protein